MSAPKVYVTNNHTQFIELPVEGGGLKRLDEGQTEHFALANRDSAQIKAWEHVQLITISDKAPKPDETAAPSIGSDNGSLSGPSAPAPTDSKPADKKA